ncbi:MAG: hypothetical protein KDD35_11745, partial [Bdellovibrionales bacterium]|nr:hypothetical protein [Bdellovibrionales bacterium]
MDRFKLSFLLRLILAVVALILLLLWVYRCQEYKPKSSPLRVMTYSSFSMPEGPGPVLKALYERRFQREVEFVEGGDSALMLEKLKALTT